MSRALTGKKTRTREAIGDLLRFGKLVPAYTGGTYQAGAVVRSVGIVWAASRTGALSVPGTVSGQWRHAVGGIGTDLATALGRVSSYVENMPFAVDDNVDDTVPVYLSSGGTPVTRVPKILPAGFIPRGERLSGCDRPLRTLGGGATFVTRNRSVISGTIYSAPTITDSTFPIDLVVAGKFWVYRRPSKTYIHTVQTDYVDTTFTGISQTRRFGSQFLGYTAPGGGPWAVGSPTGAAGHSDCFSFMAYNDYGELVSQAINAIPGPPDTPVIYPGAAYVTMAGEDTYHWVNFTSARPITMRTATGSKIWGFNGVVTAIDPSTGYPSAINWDAPTVLSESPVPSTPWGASWTQSPGQTQAITNVYEYLPLPFTIPLYAVDGAYLGTVVGGYDPAQLDSL